MLASPEIVELEVQGHSDATGDLLYNRDLSARRARYVRDRLVELGVAPHRVVARGYGPTRPVADNDTAAGRGANRRVVFEILEVAPSTETAFGPMPWR
jgi:outer membrane protein OmpA-like peptidoglycan-associated protein